MNYLNLIRPLIGAGIGYITNWIAVKMMFRPLKPIKIGKWKLPFTPGIIPKNKERIAKAIGNSISNNLLTENALTDTLLSSEKEEIIRRKLETKFNNYSSEEDIIIKEKILTIIEENSYKKAVEFVNESLSDDIITTLKDENIGNIVASQIEEVVNEKLHGSIFGIFGGKSILSKISEEISSKINEYIDLNGKEIVSNIISNKINSFENLTISDAVEKINKSNIDIVSIIMSCYNRVITQNLSGILKTIDISKVVEDKINSMDMNELEKMILDIMKKELNALVNLGALIGLVLGLLNLVV